MNPDHQQQGTSELTTTAMEVHGLGKSYSGRVGLDASCIRNYPQGQWLSREREQLTDAIDGVAGNEPARRTERICR
jgi:hypothetical protein